MTSNNNPRRTMLSNDKGSVVRRPLQSLNVNSTKHRTGKDVLSGDGAVSFFVNPKFGLCNFCLFNGNGSCQMIQIIRSPKLRSRGSLSNFISAGVARPSQD